MIRKLAATLVALFLVENAANAYTSRLSIWGEEASMADPKPEPTPAPDDEQRIWQEDQNHSAH